jgi:drug/metabolite transporter (DMT)-like permease
LKPLARSIFMLAILEMIILVAGFIITSTFYEGPDYRDVSLASAVFTVIALIVLIIFFRGQRKEPGAQTMHTLVAISIKFLAELIFAFLWFFQGKKAGISSVVLFFVLYLTFTLFSVLVILKTLKTSL